MARIWPASTWPENDDLMAKMIEVDENFKVMLTSTKDFLEKLTGKEISMVELTRILSEHNGNGLLSVKYPVILMPEKIVRGRPRKEGSIWKKYINIVLEDEPR